MMLCQCRAGFVAMMASKCGAKSLWIPLSDTCSVLQECPFDI